MQVDALRRIAREYVPSPLYKKLVVIKNQLTGPRTDKIALQNILAIAHERPLDINIETTSYCALSCTFCPNKTNRRAKSTMDMDSFVKICDDYYRLGGGAVALSSMQSDLFADNMLMQRVRHLRKFKDRFWIYTTTNLVGAKKLSDTEMTEFLETFDFIEISFGGPEREDYRKMFGVDALDSVVKQIWRMSDIIKSGNLKVRANIVVRTHDADKFLKSPLYESLPKQGNIRFASAIDTFFSWGGLVTQEHLPQGARLVEPVNTARTDCTVPWASLSINVDGSVVGCGCVDWNAQHIIGNVLIDSIADVWKSEKAKAFRTAFSNGPLPDICRTCALYHPIDSPVNQGFGRKELRDYKPTDGLYIKFPWSRAWQEGSLV